jgi:Ni/Fe-hydrogenase subunit HybB-like protein
MILLLGLFGILRLQLLARAGVLGSVFAFDYESKMFLAEFGLGVVLPILILIVPRARRSRGGLVSGALFAVLGFVMYRLNVSVTGFERASGVHYIPSLIEVTVSVGLVALGFGAFAWAVRNLPIFPSHDHASGPSPAVGAAIEPSRG